MRSSALRVLVCAVVATMACGGGDAPKKEPTTETRTIGPAGGTLAGPNGTSVVVPAGALSAELELAITANPTDAPAAPEGVASLGTVYALTPHGTSFAVPATVRIPFDAASLAAGQTPAIYKAEVSGSYAPLTTTVNDGMLEAAITGFSYVTPGAPNPVGSKYNALSALCGRRSLSGVIDCWGDLSAITQTEDYDPKQPTQVAGGRAFGQFSANYRAVCGISGTETWCAGDGSLGHMGNGSFEGSAAGVKVSAPAGVAFGMVSVGYNHVCALVASSDPEQDGRAYCWGDNTRGEIGVEVGSRFNTPQAVNTTARYVDIIAVGSTTCAVRAIGGEVDCWGDNSYGQFGMGYMYNSISRVPVQVPGVALIASRGSLAGSAYTFCGLKGSGETVCWGNGFHGQIGDGTKGTGNTSDPNDYKVPTVVSGGHVFKSLALSTSATCGRLATNELYCWGDVRNDATYVLTPALFGELPNTYKLISWGQDSVYCGVASDDNKTYCWGDNRWGYLGTGTATGVQGFVAPTPLPGQ